MTSTLVSIASFVDTFVRTPWCWTRGAGRGRQYPYDYKEFVSRVVGVDAGVEVHDDPNLDDAVVADLGKLPFDAATFDLVFSKYVLEHLDDPVRVFRELRRVTKPGGRLIVHAPNRFHYYSLARGSRRTGSTSGSTTSEDKPKRTRSKAVPGQ